MKKLILSLLVLSSLNAMAADGNGDVGSVNADEYCKAEAIQIAKLNFNQFLESNNYKGKVLASTARLTHQDVNMGTEVQYSILAEYSDGGPASDRKEIKIVMDGCAVESVSMTYDLNFYKNKNK